MILKRQENRVQQNSLSSARRTTSQLNTADRLGSRAAVQSCFLSLSHCDDGVFWTTWNVNANANLPNVHVLRFLGKVDFALDFWPVTISLYVPPAAVGAPRV
jgi:hypothetical protein